MRLLAALCLLALPAHAEQACARRAAMLDALERKYAETVQVRAMQGNAEMIEITANLATGTWTAIVTDSDGKTCVVAAGNQYTPVKPGAPA